MRKLCFSLFFLGLWISPGQDKPSPRKALDNLPLSFEENRGQADSRAKYLSRGPGYTMYLTATEVLIAGHDQTRILRMKLAGANQNARMEALDPLPGASNYFIGSDRSKWHTNIKNYRRVAVRNAYPGIDLVFYGNQRELEYDAVVAPGADPKRIRVRFPGADRMHREANGDLVVSVGTAEIRQRKPLVLQEGKPLAGEYAIRGQEVAFSVPAYDPHKTLVIDPAFVYSSYIGGTAAGSAVAGEGIAVDSSGNTYVTGRTANLGFPLINARQPLFGGNQDAFVMKINPQGTAVLYATYLGGSGYDEGTAIAADSLGNAYVTGWAEENFPQAGGLGNYQGGGDAFLAKLNPTGASLLFSAYIGGTEGDQGKGIAVDASGNAYVTGFAGPGLATSHAAQAAYGGGGANSSDAFVVKVNTVNGGVVYSTYLGGNTADKGLGVAVDGSGNAYVTGSTAGAFRLLSAMQATYGGGATDAFVSKLDPSGTLVYSTYLGGAGDDVGQSIAVDSLGNAYITGYTSGSFPLANAFRSTFGGFNDVFVTKINAQGNALVYSTYLGGAGDDAGYGIAVDSSGEALVTGYTQGGFQVTDASTFSGYYDAFVTMFNPQGNGLVYSLYLGGSGLEQGYGIATDVNGTAYVTGITASTNFPRVQPFQVNNTIFSTFGIGFVTVIAKGSSSASTLSLNCNHIGTLTQGQLNAQFNLTVVNQLGAPATSGIVTVTETLPSGFTLISISGTGWTCTNNTCSRSDSLAGNTSYPAVNVVATVPSNAPSQVTNQATVFGGGSTASSCSDVAAVGAPNTSGTPFGAFETPSDNATNVAGAVAVTGWALDQYGVSRVEIWRDAVFGDPPNSGQIFIGNAVFVTGARPDVQATYPSYPNANRAGWGYMLLTNFLPNSALGNGNGTFRLHAYAYSTNGGFTELGSPGKNITCNNANAVKPFGTIDTPGQGATVSGTQYVNFGWALTPGAFVIPGDGSTISVTVDGVSLGHPTYNQFRSDVASAFPTYTNHLGAVGFLIIDTTTLSNGVHTIGWLVTDNGARSDGIGSRFFSVLNSTTTAAPDEPIEAATNVTLHRGLSSKRQPQKLTPASDGRYHVFIEEMDRIELHAGAASGYSLANGEHAALPIGSTLKGGVFYWQPGPGFLGDYDLMLIRPDGEEVPLRVSILPKTYF